MRMYFAFFGNSKCFSSSAMEGERWPTFAVLVERDYILPDGRTGIFVRVGIAPCTGHEETEVTFHTGWGHVKVISYEKLPF